jgi:hypothetical protein
VLIGVLATPKPPLRPDRLIWWEPGERGFRYVEDDGLWEGPVVRERAAGAPWDALLAAARKVLDYMMEEEEYDDLEGPKEHLRVDSVPPSGEPWDALRAAVAACEKE